MLVEAASIQSALLGGFPVIDDKIVRTNPYIPYSANFAKIPIGQAPRRVVQYLQDELNDETVRLTKKKVYFN